VYKTREVKNAIILKADIRGGRAILAAAEFRDVHRLQCLHGRAYLAIAAFFVENEAESIRPVTIFLRENEGMENRFHRMLLSAESQTAWQTKLLSM